MRNNASRADNQQERLRFEGWISGFVDGEGCFTISIIRNRSVTTRQGWQIFPEFVVSQGEKSRTALQKIERYFECGYINLNTRRDNHHEQMLKYCVRSIHDLDEKIIPFFERNKLKTSKKNDFQVFKKVIKLMIKRKHLSEKGLERVRNLLQTMNRRKYERALKSSETICQTLPLASK
ncbi:TPA: endonuclease [Candidatus Falkowbacteria bacterium]|nr:endonuclease [Candidatus Falkowbacteria bacterium]